MGLQGKAAPCNFLVCLSFDANWRNPSATQVILHGPVCAGNRLRHVTSLLESSANVTTPGAAYNQNRVPEDSGYRP